MLSPFRSKDSKPAPLGKIHWTEVIYPSDPRSLHFGEDMKKELQGLIHRGTWKKVLIDELLVCSDVSYSKNHGGSSQLGYIIFLLTSTMPVNPLFGSFTSPNEYSDLSFVVKQWL